jgi:5-methylcytosine-specific restriction endonuclease McrA
MSSGDTLILNSDGHPLSIIPLSVISWQEAIKLLYQEKVVALENYSDWVVHSQWWAINVPAIVMTKKFHEQTTRVRFTKNNLYFRDNGQCQYCGEHFSAKELTMDHVLPRSLGGKKVWTNIVLSCGPCNWERGSDHRIKPIHMAKRPTYYELVNRRKKFPIHVSHESWNTYLNWEKDLVIFDGAKEESGFNLDSIKDLKK